MLIPGVSGSLGSARRAASVPLAGAGTSIVAPGISTSATRSPSVTRSPTRTGHRLNVARGAPSSGTVIDTRRDSVTGRYHVVGVIAGPHERPGDNLLEAQQPRARGE